MTSARNKPTGKASAHYVEVPPAASRTMQALREMGYDSYAAIMDLIDNAIDAGAREIEVTIRDVGDKALVIDLLDDGCGMSEEQLADALRLGSEDRHDATKDLGKFGMGLVTASISMARNVFVLTRQAGEPAFEATFDLDVIDRENRFVIALKPASSKQVFATVKDHGTLVRLSQIDRINDTNVSRFAANLRERLGRVYRHFLSAGVNITVNRRRVQRYDPLMLDHPETEVVLDTELDLGDGTSARLVVVELPDLGTAGDAEADIFPHNSGFYVVRNRREIIAGETFGFYRHHHSYSHFRAELSYSGTTAVFHEDVKKASIHPDDRLLDKLRKLTERLIGDSGRRGRDREIRELNLPTEAVSQIIGRKFGPVKAPTTQRAASAPVEPAVSFVQAATETPRFFTAHRDKGTLEVAYNAAHPIVRFVAERKQRVTGNMILQMVAYALGTAEQEIGGDSAKVIERASEILATLAEE